MLYEPDNVFTILLCDILHVLQFLGKHFSLIKVVVEPESNKTFSNLPLDFVSSSLDSGMRCLSGDMSSLLR